MAELRGDLALDTSSAEGSIAALEPLFDASVSAFQSGIAEALDALTVIPPPEIDTTSIETALSDSGTAGAEAISSTLTESINAAGTDGAASVEESLAGITAPPVEVVAEANTDPAVQELAAIQSPEPVVIEVDTSSVEEATTAVENLGSAAGGASGGVDSLKSAAGGLDAVSGLATGSVAGLGAAVGAADSSMIPIVGTVAGIGAAVGAFVGQAVEAEGATQRFQTTLGDMATKVENLSSIDGLNTTLGEMALQLGSDDDELRNAVSSLFQLADASGVAKEDAARFSEEVATLGARAVALNPQIGSVGAVTEGLSSALVRGGRFAAKYGLDLSGAEIQARALNDTGKSSVDQLSFVEKAMAGAALASEKYGGDLENVLAKGAENSITVQARLKQTIDETIEALGKPLIAPVFELMDGAQPVVEALGTAVSNLAQAALPSVLAILEGLTPILQVFAEVIASIPGPVLASAVSFLALQKAGHPILAIIGALLPVIEAIDGDLAKWIITIAGTVGAVIGLVKAFDAMKLAFASNPIGLIAVGLATLISTFSLAGGSARDFGKEVTEASKLSDAGIRKMVDSIGTLGNANLGNLVSTLGTFHEALDKNVGTAERLGKALVEKGVISQDEYEKSIRRAIAAQQQANSDSERSTELIDGQTQAQKDATDALNKWADAALSKLPQAADVFDSTAQVAKNLFGPDALPSPEALQAMLQQQIDAITHFQEVIRALYAAGLDNIAQLVIDKGPVVGGAFGQMVLDGNVQTQQGLEQTLTTYNTKGGELESLLKNDIGPRLTTAWQEFHSKYPTISRTEWENANAVAEAEGAVMVEKSGKTGTAATDAYGKGIDPIPGKTKDTYGAAADAAGNNNVPDQSGKTGKSASDEYDKGVKEVAPNTSAAFALAADIVNQQASILGSPARQAGLVIGSQLGEGINSGIEQWDRTIQNTASRIIANAESAARSKAQAASPSKLFAALGSDMGDGLLVGWDKSASEVIDAAEQVVRDTWAATNTAIEKANAQQVSLNSEAVVSAQNAAATARIAREQAAANAAAPPTPTQPSGPVVGQIVIQDTGNPAVTADYVARRLGREVSRR